MSLVRKFLALTVGVAFLLGAVLTARYFVLLRKYRDMAARITIKNVDLAKVPDGTYTGSYDIDFVADRVAVTVQDHRIENIAVVKDVSVRGALALPVIDRVIAAQSLRVDTVSGATNSSKVILKAVENALSDAPAASAR